MTQFNRRSFLKVAGVSICLPSLEAFSSKKNTHSHPQRFVAMQMPFGFLKSNLYPTSTAAEFELSEYLKPLEGREENFTLFRGLHNPGINGGHDANYYFLNCVGKGHQSIDSLIADRMLGQTRLPAMIAGAGLRSGCSINRIGVKIPKQSNPASVYEKMFLTSSPNEIAKQRKSLNEGKSILDVTLEVSKGLMRKVGHADKEKLDQYFTSIRDIENEMKNQLYWLDQDLPKHEKLNIGQYTDIISNFRLFTKLFVLMIQTDTTRVMSYDFGQTRHVQKLSGVTGGYHNISHHRGNRDSINQLKIIESEMFRIFADFVHSLAGQNEEEKSLLDSTHVVFGSGLEDPNNHSAAFPPIILAGGDYKHQQFISWQKSARAPLANLYLSILQKQGFEDGSFANSSGTIDKIT